MAGNTSASANQAMQQSDRQNKYAQVMRQAHVTKKNRADLESDDWMWRRNPNQVPPPPNAE